MSYIDEKMDIYDTPMLDETEVETEVAGNTSQQPLFQSIDECEKAYREYIKIHPITRPPAEPPSGGSLITGGPTRKCNNQGVIEISDFFLTPNNPNNLITGGPSCKPEPTDQKGDAQVAPTKKRNNHSKVTRPSASGSGLRPSGDEDSKSRRWALTMYNLETAWDELRADNAACIVGQVEKCPKTGRLHLQVGIYYKSQRVWPKKKYPTAHIAPEWKEGSQITYCTKPESRIVGPFLIGKLPKPGERTDLQQLATAVVTGELSTIQIAQEKPDIFVRYYKGLQALEAITTYQHRTEKPEVIWRWGPTGAGKTYYAYERFGADEVYMKDGTQWWDGYQQEKCILIDDFDGKWPFRDLLRLLDKYKYQGQIKGGYIPVNSPHIVITSEFHPMTWYQGTQLAQVMRRLLMVVEHAPRAEHPELSSDPPKKAESLTAQEDTEMKEGKDSL